MSKKQEYLIISPAGAGWRFLGRTALIKKINGYEGNLFDQQNTR